MRRRLVLLGLVRKSFSLQIREFTLSEGFYSLFSVTDEPFVTSGGTLNQSLLFARFSQSSSGKWMGFYWKDKKDQVEDPSKRWPV